MAPLRFRVSSINVSESGRNSPAPENPTFRDWFARDSPLQQRVCTLDLVVAQHCGSYDKPGTEQRRINDAIITEIILPGFV